MSFGSPAVALSTLAMAALASAITVWMLSASRAAASSSVIWRTEASEALTLSMAPPVRRSLTTPRRSASEASTEAGRFVIPSLRTKASMPSTTLVAEATSSSSGRAFALAESASTSARSAGTPSAAVPMLASEVLAVASTSLRLATSCSSVAWSTSARAEARIAASWAGASWMPLLADQPAGVGEQQAEVLRRLADALGGDERVDVGEERDRPVHHVLERQLGDALQHALGGGGDAGDVGRRARQQRVGLGVAVERRPAAASGTMARSTKRVWVSRPEAASWARRPCSTWLARRSSAARGRRWSPCR